VEVKKISWWHERLADWMIINPAKTLRDAAVEFDCTPTWIYTLKNSDTFREYWLRRSHDASDGNSANSLLAKTGALAEIALDRLIEKIDRPPVGEGIQAPFLLEVANTALAKLGYGSKPAAASAGGPSVQINVGIVSPEKLAAAREKMKQLHGVTVSTPAVMPPVEAEGVEQKGVDVVLTGEILSPISYASRED
jgi:hypothetical protein